jgi:hypothetical protein
MSAVPASHTLGSGEALECRMRELAAQEHAIMAELSGLATEYEDGDYWKGAGMRSCADWIIVQLGFNRYTAETLLRAGHAALALPEVGQAFSAGELSLDKVRSVSTVATSQDQAQWVEVAREASPPQLARLCRQSRNAALVDAPARVQAQRAQRSLRTWWDDLGMLQLHGALLPDDGAMVRAALESVGRRLAAERSDSTDPAEDPAAALRADALVAACGAALGGDAPLSPAQMVVHVDLGVLTGESPDGRCHIDNGPALSTAVARRLGCDAEIVTIIERDGSPLDVGREGQIVSTPMRRAVQSRDGTCRFPGCTVPASRCQPHHIRHWADLGPTRRWNLLSLCAYHHHRHHDWREFDIRPSAEGDLRFETADGRLIGMATGGWWKVPRTRAGPG